MTRVYQVGELLANSEYSGLREATYKRVGLGLVLKDDRVLVARKVNGTKSRTGKLVVPGGHVNETDLDCTRSDLKLLRADGYSLEDVGYMNAAMREVAEETGLVTRRAPEASFPDTKGRAHIMRRDGLTGIYIPARRGNPFLYVLYDDGKAYACRVVDLEQADPSQQPATQTDADVVDPRFVPLAEAFANPADFTAATNLLLERIAKRGLPKDKRFSDEDIELEGEGDMIYYYLKTKIGQS